MQKPLHRNMNYLISETKNVIVCTFTYFFLDGNYKLGFGESFLYCWFFSTKGFASISIHNKMYQIPITVPFFSIYTK